MIGQRLGQYRIESKLGEGGMGVVYLARDEVLGRAVAIKVLQGAALSEPTAKARFLKEARAIAALGHPAIAIVYQAGEADSVAYLAMEYLPGRTLREELARGPLGPERLLRFAGQLASALEHAHARGVLHRDIKSSNVMLVDDDHLKLLDFGLAQILATGDSSATLSQLTASGTWVGTLLYAAPEVISGYPASFRSDLYSLGVLMYEMACGQTPFSGLPHSSITAAILQGKVEPVSQRNPAIPPAIAAVIRRAMSARVEDRYAGAAELLKALQACSPSVSGTSPRPATASEASLIVLGFQNLSGDASMDWLGTGIAETLVSDLKKVKSVQVVSPERVRGALRAAADADPTALGERLGARWVVSGSYQRGGPRLRITPRIHDVASGELIATDKVDGAFDDVFDLQDRVVQEVVGALRMQVDSTTMERIVAPDTRHLQAYEAYAQGRARFHQLGKSSLEEARQLFERALQLDPDYAMAHSGIGAAYCMRYIHRSDQDDLVKAVGHLERARELDRELAEPYPWLCYAYMRQGKLDDAIAAGRRGVDLQPDLVTAHYFLATAYTIASQVRPELYQAAADGFATAIRTDPAWLPSWLVLSEIASLHGEYATSERCLREVLDRIATGRCTSPFQGAETLLANVAFCSGDWTKALQYCRDAMQILATVDHMYREPLIAVTSCIGGDCHLRLGRADAALVEFRRAWQMVNEFPRMLGIDRVKLRASCGMASSYAAAGDQERAREWLERIDGVLSAVRAHPETWVFGCSLAQLTNLAAMSYLRNGDAERALELLEQAFECGAYDARWLGSDPEFEPIRLEPRFQAVLERIRTLTPIVLQVPQDSSALKPRPTDRRNPDLVFAKRET